MKRDSVTLSEFIRNETRKLKKELFLIRLRELDNIHRLNAMPDFAKYRRENSKRNRKLWPLREHPGDFSQSLDRFVFPKRFL